MSRDGDYLVEVRALLDRAITVAESAGDTLLAAHLSSAVDCIDQRASVQPRLEIATRCG